MKILEKWWMSILIYLLTIILSLYLLKHEESIPYSSYLMASSSLLIFASVIYSLIKRQWLNAFLGCIAFFSVTVISIILIIFIGLLKAGSQPFEERPVPLTVQYYEGQFEEHTKTKFPTSAKFIAKDDTVFSPGFDHTAKCLVKLNEDDFNNLFFKVDSDPTFEKYYESIDLGEEYIANNLEATDFTNTYKKGAGGLYYLAFNKKERIVAMKIEK